MRNDLLGYLVGALESDEQSHIERELSRDEQLRGELEILSRSLAPLESDGDFCNPPPGLVQRTIQFVIAHAALHVTVPASAANAAVRSGPNWTDRPVPTRRWRFADVSVAAGILVAALSVVVPAIIQSRANAQRLACGERLTRTYAGVVNYADFHNGLLPMATPVAGYQGKAGVSAVALRDGGFIESDDVICPGSELAADGVQIPSMDQLRAATGSELEELMRVMSGSFAYTVGYREKGMYRALRLKSGKDFPIMADLPGQNGKPVGHHGGCGSNVLTADGRVFYVNLRCWPGTRDAIYTNNNGEQDAGTGKRDRVVLPGWMSLRLP